MQFLTIEDLMTMFKVSEVTIGRWVKAGTIPAPVRLGRRAIRWRASDLEAFITTAQRR